MSSVEVLQSVDAERRAAVAIDIVSTSQRQWQRNHRRPAALTPREALAALQFEGMLVAVAAANVRNGMRLSDEDFERLALSIRWINSIAEEVLG